MIMLITYANYIMQMLATNSNICKEYINGKISIAILGIICTLL
jgi:hypothetical protein